MYQYLPDLEEDLRAFSFSLLEWALTLEAATCVYICMCFYSSLLYLFKKLTSCAVLAAISREVTINCSNFPSPLTALSAESLLIMIIYTDVIHTHDYIYMFIHSFIHICKLHIIIFIHTYIHTYIQYMFIHISNIY